MTEKREVRGGYILRAMEQLGLSGDAYTTAEDLYAACRRNRNSLSSEAFREDKAFLLREGFLHQEGRRLYLRRVWQYENAAAQSLADILSANDLPGPVLPEMLTAEEMLLTAEQRTAVGMALSHRLSIILGGAGSGKTTLIQALVRHRPRALPGCVLCAPPARRPAIYGNASDRLPGPSTAPWASSPTTTSWGRWSGVTPGWWWWTRPA